MIKEFNLILLSYYMKEKNMYNCFEKRENNIFFEKMFSCFYLYLFYNLYILFIFIIRLII
jgi:hypothetical protein